ncbi:unnamed protein product [Hymenolepis diminuta]|uniref:[heparan sulfate]-glucosamine N-sulfotransferase n=2 Tax=Hymenolepis diminuta TaxID=6216 RepID=A0A0R3SCD0_HYMDI|nr:unnamed protein product [Hymenolepis diminuta]
MLLYRMNLMEDQPFELPYIQTHNLITTAPSSPSKNYSSIKHPRPLILVITAFDQQISEDAKLITSVVQSLRISVYPLLPHLIYTQLHQLIRSKSFQLVIFEDILMYFKLPASIKTALDEYCKANNVNIIAFPKNLNTLKSLPNNENFSELDPSYPLVIRRFTRGSPPQGFYLSRENDVLYAAKAGQVDTRSLINQVPPCRDWQRKSSRCFQRRQEIYPQLLAETASHISHFFSLLPGFDSVLRRSSVPEDLIKIEEQQWAQSWVTFVPRESTDLESFQTIAFAKVYSGYKTDVEQRSCAFDDCGINGCRGNDVYQALVVKDVGKVDGVERILFAFEPLQHWSTTLLLSDAIQHFLKDIAVLEYELGLVRYIHIDIDDVFLAPTGTRMTSSDVKRGNPQEQLGDEALIKNRHQFKWFCHTFSHAQPHTLSEAEMTQQLELNKAFAKEKDLPIEPGYSVAPHHSGVYPVVPHLYRAWKTVWNINVTTTEGYPYLFPASSRRGFNYMGVQVLPRQVSGVYTTTTRLATYPGGADKLDGMAFGGDLFDTFLFRPVNFYMTHFGNYAQDRLALYVFERLFAFIKAWTRLEIRWAPIWLLVEKHLKYNPLERRQSPSSLPVYSDPCVDARHEAIWFPSGCTPEGKRLPKAIIVGPQKTGTTALLAFMAMHPKLQPNKFETHAPFEEIQFFSDNDIYSKGVAFYNDRFLDPSNGLNFEKSATYFESPLAAQRMATLLPHAKVIVLLRDPLQRALSWYHHQRAHNIQAALKFTFNEVLNANTPEMAKFFASLSAELSPKSGVDVTQLSNQLHQLNFKCVEPSRYATYLRQWLHYYRANQILLIDVNRFESKPAEVLRDVQEFLNTSVYIDYSLLLSRNPSKGYFCAIDGPYPKAGRLLKPNHDIPGQWCLSADKGRTYNHSAINNFTSDSVFAESNHDLANLLLQYPFWRSSRSTSVMDLFPRWLNSHL